MEEQVKFKKPSVNFEAILQKQRKMEDDEKFAISDSLQEFIAESSKQAGYQNQDKLDQAGIRQELINYVENYEITNLDGLKGADYDEAVQVQKTTEKELEEIEKTGQLNDAELEYIRATVGETNKKLGEILGVSTRLKLAFRDFKKELKPLKLAARLGITNIPIIGKRVERAIRAEEEGEAEALRIKRGLRKREARETRKAQDTDFFDTAPKSETQQAKTTAKQVTSQIMSTGNARPEMFRSKEQAVEEERESDKQFDTTSGTLERILEESELTNELLGKGGFDKSAGGFGLSEGILGYLGIKKFIKFIKGARVATMAASLGALGTAIAGLAAPLALIATIVGIPAFLAYLNRAQGPEEKKEMAEQGTNFSGSYMNEGVLQEDIDEENRRRLESINRDEYKKLRDRGDLDNETTLEAYAAAKKEAGVGNRVTSYFTGKLKDDKVEKVLQVLSSGATTTEGDVVTNTDTTSITNNTEKKINNAKEMNESAQTKAVESIGFTKDGVTVNNNIQNNDNSNNTNKTEYGSSTIGSQNKSGFVDFY